MIRRFLIVVIVLVSACTEPETPAHPPPRRASKDVLRETPPPPPPPDYSYAPVPEAIARVLADPDATIQVLVLAPEKRPGPTFRGFSIVRRETLDDLKRDRIAAALTSAVTYGKLSGFCSSSGIGFHLASVRFGGVDVWIDPAEARVEILGESRQVLSGVRLFREIARQFNGERGCG